MLFPIGDDQVKGGFRPIVSYSFIALNVIAFLLQTTDPTQQLYVMEFGSIPYEISRGIDVYTLITSMFMHGGFMHILGNMLFLWVFGDNIESTIGSVKFAMFYIMGGIAASALHIVLAPESMVPCVGASGAIAAVMGAYLVMYPKSKIKMLFVMTMSTFRIGALYFLGFWIAQQLFSGIGALNLGGGERATDGGGVAYWAHIGGFIFGLLGGYFFKAEVAKIEYAHQEQQAPVWRRYVQ